MSSKIPVLRKLSEVIPERIRQKHPVGVVYKIPTDAVQLKTINESDMKKLIGKHIWILLKEDPYRSDYLSITKVYSYLELKYLGTNPSFPSVHNFEAVIKNTPPHEDEIFYIETRNETLNKYAESGIVYASAQELLGGGSRKTPRKTTRKTSKKTIKKTSKKTIRKTSKNTPRKTTRKTSKKATSRK